MKIDEIINGSPLHQVGVNGSAITLKPIDSSDTALTNFQYVAIKAQTLPNYDALPHKDGHKIDLVLLTPKSE